MSRRMEGRKHQPPWAWFVYCITFKHYEMCGYASENGAKRQVAALNKCKGGVWEAHTREQLVAGKHPVTEIHTREWLLYEIGVRKELPVMPPMPPHLADWMFPLQRAVFPRRITVDRFVYPIGDMPYPKGPKDELWPPGGQDED